MIYIIVGIVAGILSGLFGVGGGIIIVPALIAFGITQTHAVGISLAVIVPTALVGAIRHYYHDPFELKVALFVAIGASAGAFIGVWAHRQFSSQLFTRCFGILMVIVGINMIIKTFK